MKTFLIVAMCFLAASASSSFAFSHNPREKQGVGFSMYEICSEVAHELNSAVINGQIKSSQAQEVISRCFEQFI